MKTGVVAFFLSCLSASLITKAQDAPVTSASSDFKRFEIGVHFSPDVTGMVLRNKDGGQTIDWIIESRNRRETPKFGTTTGLSFGYWFTKAVGIETGVFYSNMGNQTEKLELTFGQMVDPRYGFNYPTSSGDPVPTHARFIYSFHYVSIPVKVNFSVGKNKWKFVSSIGVVTEFLTQATTTAVLLENNKRLDSNTEEASEDFQLVNLSPTVWLGVEYAINPSMSLRAMPTARFGVLPIIDAPITGYLYSAGLQIGYYYKL